MLYGVTSLMQFLLRSTNTAIGSARQLGQKSVITGTIIAALFVLSAAVSAHAQTVLTPVLSAPAQSERFASPVPAISGSAFDAEEVLVFIDAKLNGVAAVANGTFTYQPFLPLGSGEHNVRVQARDVDSGMTSDNSGLVTFYIIPNPSPILLVPEEGAELGQSRAWVGGVASNNSLVRILIDGNEYARTQVKNGPAGTASFGVRLFDLSLGTHSVVAVARDAQGKESFPSKSLFITIVASTPAPILLKPVVNADSGIERPFIRGFAKNGLVVSIVIDGRIVATITPPAYESGTASFAWQPDAALSLGMHTIEAFASDGGKLSNNAVPALWRVGEAPVADAEKQPVVKVKDTPSDTSIPEPAVPPLSVSKELAEQDDFGVGGPEPEKPALKVAEPDTDTDTKKLTVTDSLEPEEEPVVADDSTKNKPDAIAGRVVADDDKGESGTLAMSNDIPSGENKDTVANTLEDEGAPVAGVTEFAPGAVSRRVAEDGESFTFNTSLIIGIVILMFLLLSILVWYIQEKKEALSQKVVDIFREDVENVDAKESTSEPQKPAAESKPLVGESLERYTSSTALPKDESMPPDEDRDEDDFPPPPPPMF